MNAFCCNISPGSCLKAWLFASLMAAPACSHADTGLFTNAQPLDLELSVDLGALCRDPDGAGCEDTPAKLIYHSADGSSQTLAIRLKTRGEWRLDPSNCTYPPLFLKFGDDTAGTPFQDQDMLPMTTQCRARGGHYRDWVMREYLAYRIYGMLSEKSVRTRLARVTWTQPSGGRAAGPYWAFLAEHFRSMAKRNEATILATETLNIEATEAMELATMELFQFMIGNVDWSALKQHNVLLIKSVSDSGKALVTAVPFDFDFSGLVAATYAAPPPDLPIVSVRQRLYRGLCNSEIDWSRLFDRFQDIRPQVFELLEGLPGLSSAYRRGTRKYLMDFYSVIDDPKLRQQRIISQCRPN